mgnify:CR=1 FL=1
MVGEHKIVPVQPPRPMVAAMTSTLSMKPALLEASRALTMYAPGTSAYRPASVFPKAAVRGSINKKISYR